MKKLFYKIKNLIIDLFIFLKSVFIKLFIFLKTHFSDYRFTILFIISVGFVLLAVFAFKDSYLRFIHAIRDFGLSVAFYFCRLFEIDYNVSPSVSSIDESYNVKLLFIPTDLELFKEKVGIYFSSLWNLESFKLYSFDFINGLSLFCRILLVAVPFVIIFILLFRRYFDVNEDSIDDEDSKPLRIYRKYIFKAHIWIKDKIIQIVNYLFEGRFFKSFWILIWLFSFNIATVIVEFFAFYFYFVISLDLANIFIQIYKLICDFKAIPYFIKFVFLILIIRFLRIRLAYARLNHYEMRNRGFINSLGLVVLITGVTGKGKTLLMTDLALSQEVMFRDVAFEKILNNDVKFPNFPYATFETELKKSILEHQVYSLSTCEIWINKKRSVFEKKPSIKKIFGYDYINYGLYHNNGLGDEYIFDMLEKYVKLFFIYTIESSLLISNYGIRVDNSLQSANHFPMWDSNFFRNPYESEYYSRHSHIIDFDILRLGKKVIENNPLSDSVEFGVYVITEFDKERGNQLTNQSFKADSDDANPKNDLTELCEKIHRHSSTVDNYPFLRIFTDSQRAMSVMADNREIAEKIVNITDVGDTKNTLFLFFFDEMIYDFFFRRFEKWYYKYRFARSDNTLMMYFFHKICAWFISRYNRKVNNFGFAVYGGDVQKSTLDGSFDSFKWYRLNKKIYADRYKSNCFKDYWNEKSLRSSVGLNDLREYDSTQATIEELKLQHSYWIDKLNDVLDK